jgi:hypothetical protein
VVGTEFVSREVYLPDRAEVSDSMVRLLIPDSAVTTNGKINRNQKGEDAMKAAIFFTGSGPIVILTSYASLTAPNFVEKLAAKGLSKFVAYEADMEEVRKKYGKHFDVIMKDLHQSDDLRVLDYDGHRVFRSFTLSKLGQPIYHEP